MPKKCQIFTPPDIACEMLDTIDYISNLVGKKLIETSCGDGSIIIEAVKRYINDAKKQGFSNKEIAISISRDIYGFEIDKVQLDILFTKVEHNYKG